MPGHKGMGEVETFDITEIEGADVLYSPKGIIRESENNAARLFGTARTVYSAEGSSLSIRAMLDLAMLWGKEQGKGSTVLAARNAHKTFISGAALLDLDVEWIYGEGSTLCECEVGAAELDAKLEKMHRAGKSPFAVYLTSPDYLGNILDIRALSEVCRKYGVLCLVDNAHGAYLAFFENSMHPIALGAHMCADSAHKTLPVLTGGSYLHLSLGLPEWTYARADDAMALFASTRGYG